MNFTNRWPSNIAASIAGLALAAVVTASAAGQPGLSPKEQLGKALFFDTNLSTPSGTACAAWHGSEAGFTGPDAAINAAGAAYEGAVSGRFGNRKPPTAAYAGDSPVLYLDATAGNFAGGMFWDGRATGWTLGDPLAEQAQGPFLNPLEHNNASPATVVAKVSAATYAPLFEQVWGFGSLSSTNVSLAYERIARSIADYERSKEVSPFSSRFDASLGNQAKLTQQENDGFQLFLGKGNCANCHSATSGSSSERPLFTDFTFDNLGSPKNPANPFYAMPPEFNPDGTNWIDQGLGAFLTNVPQYALYVDANLGKHKVPTLRNVDKRPAPGFVKAYSHNGYFKSLKEIVHFYNTRDLPGAGWNGVPWPPPEEPLNMNTVEMGNLGLTDAEEDAIVAFLQTLTDGYPAIITVSPTILKEGSQNEIAALISGEPAPELQWYFNSVAIPGGTNATLILPAVTRLMEGIYWLVASNALGQATSAPIAAMVSNVDPERFLELQWPGHSESGLSLESADRMSPGAGWLSLSNYPPASTGQRFVELKPLGTAGFYRLNGSGAPSRFTGIGFVNGWQYAAHAGTQQRIEYMAAATGWTNWLLLTNLVLPARPYLFVDDASLGAPARVYRTTPMP